MKPLPLLDIAGLHVEFHDGRRIVQALHGVDLTLGRGEALGVVGESGSGKSTLALALLGLLDRGGRIAADRLRFDGSDLLRASESERHALRGRRIGMVFQEPMSSLHPMQTIGAQIGESLRLHRRLRRRDAREHAIELLQQVGIDRPEQRIDAYPHQLSGGQRQRAMIAQAIASEPDLLIADEPTTALDPATRRQVLALLRELQQRLGMALLLVSHDLALIGEVADRLLVLRDGRRIESGPAAQILREPVQPYTRALLACRPRPRSECDRLPTVDALLPAAGAPDGAGADLTAGASDAASIPAAIERDGTRPLLQVRGLVVRHHAAGGWFAPRRPPAPTLDGVSFSLARGRTLGLLGASGSGKTTLGRAVLRLLEPEAGAVVLDGVDLSTTSPTQLRALRRKMQIVFQDPIASLDPRMTIAALLVEPLAVHRIGADRAERIERAAALLRRVGLDPAMLERYPHEFSGGQRQRIAIARALAVAPELIVCDECVSALDLSVQAQVLNLLRDLQDELGIAYLFITHDLAVARFMADELAVLHRGRLVEAGPTEQVVRDPRHEQTRLLVAEQT